MTFSALPPVPQVGVPEWQFQFLNGVKQNVELLTGQRGVTGFEAIVTGQISVQPIGELGIQQTSAQGSGFTISGSDVASLDDYIKLLIDVNTLIGDVAYIKAVLNALIGQLQR
jgi:hypothetical protein